jgi:hypothetical protein
MGNSFSNKGAVDAIDDLTPINYFCTILARLAYLEDKHFMDTYLKVIGVMEKERLMSQFNAPTLKELFEKTMKSAEMKRIAKEVNGMIEGPLPPCFGKMDTTHVDYISIANYNYGETYVVADDRFGCMYVIFRGTYSPKTAASYTKLSSITPTKLSNGDGFVFGIYKIMMEVAHCIVEAIFDLKQRRFKDRPVSIITCGHSLGGAMATIFSYVWKLISAKGGRFEVFPEIGCVSIGAPRTLNIAASDRYCQFAEQGKIVFKRIANIGDPVPALPVSKFGFQHPCSTNKTVRQKIYQECRSNAKGSYPFLSISDNPLTCSSTGAQNKPTPAAHMLYLNISFVKALNPAQFLSGLGPASIEVKNPQARIVFFSGTAREVFFTMEDVRTLERSSGYDVREDDRVTPSAFAMLKSKSTEVTCAPRMSGDPVQKSLFTETADSYTKIVSANTPPVQSMVVDETPSITPNEVPDPTLIPEKEPSEVPIDKKMYVRPFQATVPVRAEATAAAAGGTRRRRARRRTRRRK